MLQMLILCHSVALLAHLEQGAYFRKMLLTLQEYYVIITDNNHVTAFLLY